MQLTVRPGQKHVPGAFSPKARQVCVGLVRAIHEEAQRRGWPKLYFAPIDEPGNSKTENRMKFAESVLDFVHEVPGAQTAVTITAPDVQKLGDRVDVRIYAYGHYNRNKVLEEAKQGHPYWWYANGMFYGQSTEASRVMPGFELLRPGAEAVLAPIVDPEGSSLSHPLVYNRLRWRIAREILALQGDRQLALAFAALPNNPAGQEKPCPNLIADPSFEAGPQADGFPTAGYYITDPYSKPELKPVEALVVSDEVAHSGRYSLKWDFAKAEGKGSAYGRDHWLIVNVLIPREAARSLRGKRVRVGYWFRLGGGSATPGMTLRQFGQGEFLGGLSYTGGIEDPTVWNHFVAEGRLLSDFESLDIHISCPVPGQPEAAAKALFYIDDVSLEAIEEPPLAVSTPLDEYYVGEALPWTVSALRPGGQLEVTLALGTKQVARQPHSAEAGPLTGAFDTHGLKPGVYTLRAWVVDLPEVKAGTWRFRQLFADGERRPRTHLPETGMHRTESLPGFDWSRQWEAFLDGTRRFVSAGTDHRPWRNLYDVEMIGVTRWITNRLPFEEVDVQQRLVTFDRPSLFSLDDTAPPRPSVYWVENVFEALDTPGQWYLDRPQGRLYYLPRTGEDMRTVDLVAPRLTQLLRLVGREDAPVEHVRFEGVTFAHTEWEPPADWASSLQGATDVPGAVFLDYARSCSLRGGTIEHVGTYGVEVNVGCSDIEIAHNRMVDLGAGGVRIGHFFDHEPNERGIQRTAALPKGPHSRAITVAGNEISDSGHLFPGSVGVFVGENPDNRVVHNHVHDLPWVGISVGSLRTFEPSQATDNVVEHNHVHHLGDGVLSDIGGIYTNSIQPGTRIRYNVVHDVRHRDYGSWGIYTDQGSADILIEKNLVYRCGTGPFFPRINRNLTVSNNIFAFGEAAQIMCGYEVAWPQLALCRNIIYYTEGAAVGGGWQPLNLGFDHNLYWNASGTPLTFGGRTFAEWQAAGLDAHSLIADPLFVDPEHGDFRLRPGSPAAQVGFEPWDLSDVGQHPLPARHTR
jgi:hypothetical protein